MNTERNGTKLWPEKQVNGNVLNLIDKQVGVGFWRGILDARWSAAMELY
jgi:hypothetical protein